METSASTSEARSWYQFGCLSLASSVMLGAWGAHGLKTKLRKQHSPSEAKYFLGVWSTATSYHFIHSIGILLISDKLKEACSLPCMFFGGGLALFSGSLYTLVLTRKRRFGWITPFGGAAFVAGWIAAALRIK